MSQVYDLPGIARRLAAAGHVEHPANEGVYLLHVDGDDETDYSLICRHWTGYSYESEELVCQPVRRDTPAAYFITSTLQRIVCITSSSTLCILDYSTDEEEWVTSSVLPYNVHRDGKFGGGMTERGKLHIFFQDPSEDLIYVDVNNGVSAAVPIRLAVGSPIFVDFVNGTMYIFYIDSQDRRIHFMTMAPGEVPTDHTMSTCELREGLKRLTADLTVGEGNFSAYVLTEGGELLLISGDGEKSVLGTVDAAGGFVSGRAVDRCCADAWDGILVADHLEDYLKSDPYFINSSGGEHDITPLAAAVWKGHLDIVKLLLNHGADPNVLSPENRSPLFYATTRSPPENRSDIVHALLSAGAEVDQCYAEDNFNTPLMNAITLLQDKAVVHELLEHGASLTVQNGDGRTAGMLIKGTGLEEGLPQLRQQLQVNTPLQLLPSQPPPPVSPPQSRQGSGDLVKQLIEFFVPFVILIAAYTKTEDVLDEILQELGGVEGMMNEDGPSVKALVEGTGLEKDMPQPLANPPLQLLPPQTSPLLSPPQSHQGSGDFEKQLIEFLTPLLILVVTYMKVEDVLDEILRELGGVEGVIGEDGRTAGTLVRGTGSSEKDSELPQPRQQPLANPPLQLLPSQAPLPLSPSPQSSHQISGNLEKWLIEPLVQLLMLIVTYMKVEDVLDEILRELGGVEGVMGVIG